MDGAKKQLGVCVKRLKEEPCVYASKEERIVFDRALHKKYNAAMYFADQVPGIVPMKDALQKDTPGKQAYDNFVQALETVNQQEYVTPSHTKKPKTDEEKRAVLKIAKEELDVDEKGLDGSNWTPKQLAMWARQIKQRYYATKAASFKARLRERSMHFQMDQFKVGQENPEPKWGKCKLPPVRRQTYKILTSPPEKDFNLVLALLALIAIFTYVYNLVTQIQAITNVCSSSWICPFNGISANLPIVAPPANFRVATPDTNIVYSGPGAYYPHVGDTCKFGESGCNDPGYAVQWPYMQLGSDATPQVPVDIRNLCPKISGGATGWILDPFQDAIIPEYYDCSGARDVIPFRAAAQSSQAGGMINTTMHFDTSWYKEANVQTLECMKDAIARDVVPITDVAQWSRLTGDARDNGKDSVHVCMDKKKPLKDRLHYCKCGEDKNAWATFPFHVFYTDRETRVCSGGTRHNELCNGPANCPQGECVSAFWDQNPISTSNKYGCWFDGPTATQQLEQDIGLCGFAIWRQFFFDSSPASKRQIALETNWLPSISTRAALILIFLVKEGCFVTAFILTSMLWAVIWAVKLVLALLLAPAYWFLVRPVPFRVRTAKSVYKNFNDKIKRQVAVVWTMCVNLSTTWRIIVVMWSFFRGLVNASVKDLDSKLISVANLLYTLTLIFVRGGAPDGQLVSATALSLFLLLHKMNKESLQLSDIAAGFRCLNENRLTKFEMSLFIVKVMEKLLDDDIHYCWVENMIGAPDFSPDVHDGPCVHPDALDKEPTDYITDGTEFMGADLGDRGLDRALAGEYSRDSIKLPHEKKFGNDGLGMYHQCYTSGSERYLSQLKAGPGSLVLQRLRERKVKVGGTSGKRKSFEGARGSLDGSPHKGGSPKKKGPSPPFAMNGMLINGMPPLPHMGNGHPSMQMYEPNYAPPFAPRPSGMDGFYQPSVSPYTQHYPEAPFGGSPGYGV